MNENAVEKVPERRGDLLVSLCIVADRVDAAAVEAVRQSAQALRQHYRFWEILLVGPQQDVAAAELLFREVENFRYLSLRAGQSSYKSRVLAASEAIGDVVALTSPAEATRVDLLALMERCDADAAVVLAKRPGVAAADAVLGSLGAVGGFQVSLRHLQTMVLPRTILTTLLADPDREIALRFPRRASSMPFVEVETARFVPGAQGQHLRRRISLMHKLLVALAPRVLAITALVASIVSLAGVIFGIYAITVWFVLDSIQPGWLTTSLMLATFAAFLGLAVFGIAIGMEKLIALLSPLQDDSAYEERSSGDLFAEVKSDLNVEMVTGKQGSGGT